MKLINSLLFYFASRHKGTFPLVTFNLTFKNNRSTVKGVHCLFWINTSVVSCPAREIHQRSRVDPSIPQCWRSFIKIRLLSLIGCHLRAKIQNQVTPNWGHTILVPLRQGFRFFKSSPTRLSSHNELSVGRKTSHDWRWRQWTNEQLECYDVSPKLQCFETNNWLVHKMFVSCNFNNAQSSLSCFDFGTNDLDYFSLFLYRRHVLRFLLQSPHGYHVEMASQTLFVYGDEDTVMACLTKVLLFHVSVSPWKLDLYKTRSLTTWDINVVKT